MLRRSHILTAVALLAFCVAPGFAYGMPDQPVPSPAESSAQPYQDLRSPDARDAGQVAETQVAQDLRSPDARDAARVAESQVAKTQVAQDLRSPDARDAGRVAEAQIAQDLRSPDARDAGRPEAPTPDTVVEIREAPAGGFDWGDAGIGAAGILAMLSIAGGLSLMVTARRRRRGTEMPAH